MSEPAGYCFVEGEGPLGGEFVRMAELKPGDVFRWVEEDEALAVAMDPSTPVDRVADVLREAVNAAAYMVVNEDPRVEGDGRTRMLCEPLRA